MGCAHTIHLNLEVSRVILIIRELEPRFFKLYREYPKLGVKRFGFEFGENWPNTSCKRQEGKGEERIRALQMPGWSSILCSWRHCNAVATQEPGDENREIILRAL